MTEFTPWTHIKATGHHGHYIEDQLGFTVCDLYTMQGSCLPFENAEQHARLIAAAPDLLAALEEAEREMKIAHNHALATEMTFDLLEHVSPALQPGIAANLRTAILVANTAIARARGE